MQTTNIQPNIENQLKTFAKFTVFNTVVFCLNLVFITILITEYLF